jgi:hypothetical protein
VYGASGGNPLSVVEITKAVITIATATATATAPTAAGG